MKPARREAYFSCLEITVEHSVSFVELLCRVVFGPYGRYTNLKDHNVEAVYQIPDIMGVSTQPEYIDIGFHKVIRYCNGTRIYSVQVYVYTSSISNSTIGYIDQQFMGTSQDLYGYAVDVKTGTLYLLQILPNGTVMVKTLGGSAVPEQTLHIRGNIVY